MPQSPAWSVHDFVLVTYRRMSERSLMEDDSTEVASLNAHPVMGYNLWKPDPSSSLQNLESSWWVIESSPSMSVGLSLPLWPVVTASKSLERGLVTLIAFSFPRLMKFIYVLSLKSFLPVWNILTEEIAMQVSLPLALAFISSSLPWCSLSLGEGDKSVHLLLRFGS